MAKTETAEDKLCVRITFGKVVDIAILTLSCVGWLGLLVYIVRH